MIKWLMIGVVILAASCSLIPADDGDIIERNKFVDVLVDIHLADAIIAEKGYRVVSDSLIIGQYYDDVMKKHSISRKEFDNTIEYYTSKGLEYKHVYNDVVEKLTTLQNEFDEINKDEGY